MHELSSVISHNFDHVVNFSARIRFSPEKDWPINAGLDGVIAKLEGISRGDVSMADVIVLAGYTAIENDGGNTMPFCGNRVDASDAAYSENLAPRDYYLTTEAKVKDDIVVRGMTLKQGVALYGMPTEVFAFGEIFSILKTGTVSSATVKTGTVSSGTVTANGETYALTAEQEALVNDLALKAIVDEYADDEAAFKTAFAEAWVYMMNAGRYTGPTSNYCDDPSSAFAVSAAVTVGGVLALALALIM